MLSYLIQINEAQRLALIKLLAASVDKFQQPDPDCIEPIDSEYHPLYYWHSMLGELPRVEAEHNIPDIVKELRDGMTDGWSGDACAVDCDVAERAAVEIERLRAALRAANLGMIHGFCL